MNKKIIRADFQQKLIKLIDISELRYAYSFELAREKCGPLADNIHFGPEKMPRWIKMLLFSTIAIDLEDDERNPFLYPEFFNRPLGKAIKEVFKIFKIEILETSAAVGGITEIALPTGAKLGFLPSLFGKYQLYIIADTLTTINAAPYTYVDPLTVAQSILRTLVPQIDKDVEDRFQVLLDNAIKQNGEIYRTEDSFVNLLEGNSDLRKFDWTPRITEEVKNLLAETQTPHSDGRINYPATGDSGVERNDWPIPSSTLIQYIDENELRWHNEIAFNGGVTHGILVDLINKLNVDDKIKTLFLATLTLGDEKTNPLLNPAAFNQELGKLIQCALKCFGVRFIKGREDVENSYLIALKIANSNYSLRYSEETSTLILKDISKYRFEPPEDNQPVFQIQDQQLFDCVVNHYRNILAPDFKKNLLPEQLLIPKMDLQLANAGKRLWDGLTQGRDSYGAKTYEINQISFKNIFLRELEKALDSNPAFTREMLLENANKYNPELSFRIKNSSLNETQKSFLYWLISFDFSSSKVAKKKTNTKNPLHEGPNPLASPVVYLFLALIDFINTDPQKNIVFETIEDGHNKYFKKYQNYRFENSLIFGLNKGMSENVLKRFSTSSQMMLDQVCWELNNFLINYKIRAQKSKLIISSNYFNTKFSVYFKRIKKEEILAPQMRLEAKRKACLESWMKDLDLTKYDAIRDEAKKAFTQSVDSVSPINEGIGELIDEIKSIPSAFPINQDIGELIDEIENIPDEKMSKAKKMILYLIMPEEYRWKKKDKGASPKNSFFKGWWTRPDQGIVIDSLSIIHLLNLSDEAIELLIKYVKISRKNKLDVAWTNKEDFRSMCERRFAGEKKIVGFFDQKEVNALVKKIRTYLAHKPRDPRIY
jgi:hypothetical protein